MLAAPTTGLLLSARLLLPRAIESQARKPGTGRPATPPEQVAHGGVSRPVDGDLAKSSLARTGGHRWAAEEDRTVVGHTLGTARSGRGCSARASLTG